jgi:2-C-methyl-D-erythritol 4-phosphate cytidylyltransferase
MWLYDVKDDLVQPARITGAQSSSRGHGYTPGLFSIGMTVAALIVGAGRGERYRASLAGPAERELAKAFVPLGGRPLLEHAARALAAVPEISLVIPVLSTEMIAELARRVPGLAGIPKVGPPVAGGAERQDSVRAGLAALPAEVRLVAVHDAARPLVRPEDIRRVIAAAEASGAAILGAPVADTVKRVREGRIVETPPRSECFAAQTPQVFRTDWLREALAKAEADGVRGTDDAALVERLGISVQVVTGPATNLKITTAADLRLAEALLAEAEAARA